MSHDMVVKESRNNEFRIGSHYRVDTDRTIMSADGMYTISENSSLNFGVEYFEVKAKSLAIGEFFVDPSHGIPGDSTDFTGVWFDGFSTDYFEFDQQSAFVQYENYNDIVNFTLGLRFADHSRSTEKVTVPRIGLSKKWGNFGVKAMYSEAFRTGDAEHLNLASSPLKPETLDSAEVEFSYLHDTGLYTINFFKMEIQDSIVWNTDALTENKGEAVSGGFEASWRGKGENYEQEFNIAYYEAGADSVPSQLARDDESYIGFPTLKLTYRLDFQINEKFNFSPTIMFEDKKWWRVNLENIEQDKEVDSVLKINLASTYKVNDNMTVQLAVHDLLDEGYQFLQAYGQVNYPGDGREYSLSLQYTF
jgi:outer membrane cobalamin receptor